jgi:hypothetical protein
LREQLRDLHVRIDAADHAHEAYLLNKMWPAI